MKLKLNHLICSTDIFDFMTQYPTTVQVLSYFVANMNENNMLRLFMTRTASAIGVDESNIRKKMKLLIENGVIKRRGRIFMLNPAMAKRSQEDLMATFAEFENIKLKKSMWQSEDMLKSEDQ